MMLFIVTQSTIYPVSTTWRYRSILKANLPHYIQYIILDIVQDSEYIERY